jgi:hypothetical protein
MGTKNLPEKRHLRAVPSDTQSIVILDGPQHKLGTKKTARQAGVQVDLQRNPVVRQHHGH